MKGRSPSFDETTLTVVRRAFADTPREAFLGPGPWLLTQGVGYTSTPSDPVLAYQDRLIALKPEKQINNGSPSLHVRWLHAAQIKATNPRPAPPNRVNIRLSSFM